MTQTTRKKNSRQRGSHTHGCGSKKKRRGAGNRGGRGNAGSGKRADQKKPSYWKDTKYFSGPAFKSHKVKPQYISIQEIETIFDKLKATGEVQEKNGLFVIDFSKKPCKLLSKGKPTRKYHLILAAASKKAKEKIESAGGKLELPVLKPKKVAPKKEEVSNIKKEQVKKEQVKKEQVKKEQVKKEQVKKEQPKEDSKSKETQKPNKSTPDKSATKKKAE